MVPTENKNLPESAGSKGYKYLKSIIWFSRLVWNPFIPLSLELQDRRFDKIKASTLRFFNAWTIQGLWVFITRYRHYHIFPIQTEKKNIRKQFNCVIELLRWKLIQLANFDAQWLKCSRQKYWFAWEDRLGLVGPWHDYWTCCRLPENCIQEQRSQQGNLHQKWSVVNIKVLMYSYIRLSLN